MRTPGRARAALAAVLALSAPVSGAGPDDCATVRELASGVYVRDGRDAVVFEGRDIANVGFVVGDRCVAVIDSGGSEAEGRALGCAIRGVTEVPVCFVIATHGHPDHLLGHAAFRRPGVDFVGHQKLARDLSLVGPTYLERARTAEQRDLGPDYIVSPSSVVEQTLHLDLGGRQLQLTAHRAAHSTSDVTVLDPASGILWTGDLVFLRHVPVIAGNITGWIAVLDEIERIPASRIVPGHGPAGAVWPEASADTRRYLSRLRTQVKAWIDDGGDLWQAQDKLGRSERGNWTMFDRYHKRNIANAFAHLEWED